MAQLLRTDCSLDDFVRIVTENRYILAGQSETLVPADRAIYALRDATPDEKKEE